MNASIPRKKNSPWWKAAHNYMSFYVRESRKYFTTLTILHNKITIDANVTLTNHGTILNRLNN